MKKYNFVYLTTNLINGRKYVGKHSTNNLEDGYLGSGKLLKQAIKKNGRENFKREILEFCDSEILAWEKEKEYCVKLNVICDDTFYNFTDGGEGNNYWVGKQRSDETKNKISKSRKGLKAWNKGLPPEEQPHFGKKYSEERKNKISESHKGKEFSESHKKNLSLSHIGNKPWNKGLECGELSDEHKLKISNSLRKSSGKAVLQYNIDGSFVKEWDSLASAHEHGFNRTKVSLCCNGHKVKYKNFIWKFKFRV